MIGVESRWITFLINLKDGKISIEFFVLCLIVTVSMSACMIIRTAKSQKSYIAALVDSLINSITHGVVYIYSEINGSVSQKINFLGALLLSAFGFFFLITAGVNFFNDKDYMQDAACMISIAIGLLPAAYICKKFTEFRYPEL